MSATGPSVQPWILTGMSGAGKAVALRALEAAGASCTDNLPVAALPAFLGAGSEATRVAVVDARRGDELDALERIEGARVLFLDAPDAVLVRRLSESTRPHPCGAAGAGLAAVSAERSALVALRAAAEVVVDTGSMDETALGERVIATVMTTRDAPRDLRLTVSSFGFKYGAQVEADWVIDARVLANPFWEAGLRPLTGLDEAVRAYVLDRPETTEYLDRAIAMLSWAVGRARSRGRAALHIAVGCTGGRHRSVVVATELGERLRTGGVAVEVRHRDVLRPDPR